VATQPLLDAQPRFGAGTAEAFTGAGWGWIGCHVGLKAALDKLAKAGSSVVELHRLPHDFINAYLLRDPENRSHS
jgi:hypothetical protein